MALWESMDWSATEKWSETVQAISAPLLLITGDVAKESIVTAEVARRVTELSANVTVHRFPRAGHQIHRDCPDEFLLAVRRFLER